MSAPAAGVERESLTPQEATVGGSVGTNEHGGVADEAAHSYQGLPPPDDSDWESATSGDSASEWDGN